MRLRGAKPYAPVNEASPQNRSRPEGSPPLPTDTAGMAATQSVDDDDDGAMASALERQPVRISRVDNKRRSFRNVPFLGDASRCRSSWSPLLILLTGFALGCCCLALFHSWSLWRKRASPWRRNGGNCLVSFGTYRGLEYSTPETVKSTCLIESKFVKVQQHAVQFASSAAVIPDWVWIDYHERINVLVQAGDDPRGGGGGRRRFHVLEQTKYALEGRTSRALVGGIVEPGEDPRAAARREVREELRLDCGALVFLGRFRTDVNRGMGWTNGYLARDCAPIPASGGGDNGAAEEPNEQVGGADTERQDIKTISLAELRRSVTQGDFIEIQWTAIVSLALLHMEDEP